MEHLRGIELRSVLVVHLLDSPAPLTVAALVAALDHAGLPVDGRPGKAVSDALRWEVRRGRVVRLGRGRYGPGRMPRSTARDIRRRADVVRSRGPGAWRLEVWRRSTAAGGR